MSRDRVEVGGVEAEGTFGRVCHAFLHTSGSQPTPVILKTVTGKHQVYQLSHL